MKKTPLFAALIFMFLLCGCATVNRVDSENAQDDDLEKALPMEIGEEGSGAVGPTGVDKADWKLFVVRNSTRLRVRFTTGPVDNQLSLKIYKQNSAERVGTLSGRPGQEQTMVGNFSAGDYYIEISAEAELKPISYVVSIEDVTD